MCLFRHRRQKSALGTVTLISIMSLKQNELDYLVHFQFFSLFSVQFGWPKLLHPFFGGCSNVCPQKTAVCDTLWRLPWLQHRSMSLVISISDTVSRAASDHSDEDGIGVSAVCGEHLSETRPIEYRLTKSNIF